MEIVYSLRLNDRLLMYCGKFKVKMMTAKNSTPQTEKVGRVTTH